MNGGGIIIIYGKTAAGTQGQNYSVSVAVAQTALNVLKANPAMDTAFVTALQDAINDASS